MSLNPARGELPPFTVRGAPGAALHRRSLFASARVPSRGAGGHCRSGSEGPSERRGR